MKYSTAATLVILMSGRMLWAQTPQTLPTDTTRSSQDHLFVLLDENADGALSTEELRQAADLLKHFDGDRDGSLSWQEILSASKVPTGINDRFLDPKLDPQEWVDRFEVESREVFAAREQVVAAVGLAKGDRIADIGAGTGLFVPLFSQDVGPSGKVFAVDISPRLVEHLRRRVRAQQIKNVEVIHSQADSTELAPASVNVVFVCDTYHHFENHAEMLLSIRQALRPGGQLVLIDFERIPGKSREFILGHVRAGKEVFRREVERSGFRFREELSIPGFSENYFLRFEKVAADE